MQTLWKLGQSLRDYLQFCMGAKVTTGLENTKKNGESKVKVENLSVEQRLEIIMAAQVEAAEERQAIIEGIGEILEKLNDLVVYDNDGFKVERYE